MNRVSGNTVRSSTNSIDMSVIYRKVAEPEDIYIIGSNIGSVKHCLLLDDDYVSVEIRSGNNIEYVETDGGAYIVNLAELRELLSEFKFGGQSEYVVIRGFKGNIMLKGLIDDREVLEYHDPKLHLHHVIYEMIDDKDDNMNWAEVSCHLLFEGDHLISPVKYQEDLLKLV